MSKTYLQILELASTLSKEECLLLIKDISTALVESENSRIGNASIENVMLKNALATRQKVQNGEMNTWSIEEVKKKFHD